MKFIMFNLDKNSYYHETDKNDYMRDHVYIVPFEC